MVIFGERSTTTTIRTPHFRGFDYDAALEQCWHDLPAYRDRYITARQNLSVLEQRVADGDAWLDSNPDHPHRHHNLVRWITLDTRRHAHEDATNHYHNQLWQQVASIHHLSTHSQKQNICSSMDWGAQLDWSSPFALWRSLYPADDLPAAAVKELEFINGEQRTTRVHGVRRARQGLRAA